MAMNNVMKLVIIITVLELVIVAAAAGGQNGGYNENDFSPKCLFECVVQCAKEGFRAPLCFAQCLLQCHDPPVVSDAVQKCTATCAQSLCSKFVGPGNFFHFSTNVL